jgi:small nuclear ribonucleoprotein (snRNP)-like protein
MLPPQVLELRESMMNPPPCNRARRGRRECKSPSPLVPSLTRAILAFLFCYFNLFPLKVSCCHTHRVFMSSHGSTGASSLELPNQESIGQAAEKNEKSDAAESWVTHPATAVVKATIGRSVLIVLNDGRELQGTCTCFDWLGNLVLSKWTQNIPAASSGSCCIASSRCFVSF